MRAWPTDSSSRPVRTCSSTPTTRSTGGSGAPEALAVAQELDRPILLSVGYAACHWCHVMAHESFEDPATAAYMNDHFVNIKVDREERPDIDAVYMRATQAMTGQGGWPMTCVLTPDGEPFFAGTYFPPEPRQGMPAFTQVLQALADAWRDAARRRAAVSADVVEHLRSAVDTVGDAARRRRRSTPPSTRWSTQHDDEAGGFGASPKFPPSMVLEFLLRQHARTGDARSLAMVAATCDAMARGGIYDQLGGGFARYGVDRFWRVPHFEKMLYDNAQLLRVYLHLWRPDRLAARAERVARETADFLLDELRHRRGRVRLGARRRQRTGDRGHVLRLEPGPADARCSAPRTARGRRSCSASPGRARSSGASRRCSCCEDPDDPDRWAERPRRLLAARAERTRPARDDKVVAAWNGLAITALAEASVLLRRPALAEAAVAAAELLVGVARRRTATRLRAGVPRRRGRPVTPAVLEDHGCVAEAFIAVLGITGDPVWLDRARVLLDRVLEHFVDREGGFFDTADDAEALRGAAAGRLRQRLPVGHVGGGRGARGLRRRHRRAAIPRGGRGRHSRRRRGRPRAGAALRRLEPGRRRGDARRPGRGRRRRGAAARARRAAPRRAAAHDAPAPSSSPATAGVAIPLFEGRTEVDGKPAAYVCRDFVCSAARHGPGRPPLIGA